MRYASFIAITLLLAGMARGKGIDGQLYYLGIALDQEGAAGGWVQVGEDAGWQQTLAGVVLNGKLYTTESGGGLYVADLSNGAWQQLGKLDFAQTRFMLAAGNELFTIEESGNLYRVDPANGNWSQ